MPPIKVDPGFWSNFAAAASGSSSPTDQSVPNTAGHVFGGAAPLLAGAMPASDLSPPTVDEPAMPEPGSVNRDRLMSMAQASYNNSDAVAQGAGAALGPQGAISEAELGAQQQNAQAGDEIAAVKERHAKELADVYSKAGQAEDIRQKSREIDREKMERHAAELQKTADLWSDQAMNAEVKNFWADKSTGSRILGVIAQTLSGAANGLAGNPGAPSPLDRIIDRDVELQKANLANKQAGAVRASGALSQAYNNFKDKTEADLAVSDAAYKMVALKFNQQAELMKGETAGPENQQAQAVIKQKLAENEAARTQHAQDNALKGKADSMDTMAQLARDQSNESRSQMAADAAKDKNMVLLPGVDGPVPKSLVNGEWLKTSSAFASTLANTKTIENSINEPGFSFEGKTKADVAKALMTGDVRTILGTGANLSDNEAQDVKAIVRTYVGSKSVESLTPVEMKGLFRAIRVSLARSFQARVRGRFAGRDFSGGLGFDEAYGDLKADDAAHAPAAQ